MKIKFVWGYVFFFILSIKVISCGILRKNLRFPQLFLAWFLKGRVFLAVYPKSPRGPGASPVFFFQRKKKKVVKKIAKYVWWTYLVFFFRIFFLFSWKKKTHSCLNTCVEYFLQILKFDESPRKSYEHARFFKHTIICTKNKSSGALVSHFSAHV